MSKLVDHVKYICSEAETNNNKVWEAFLYDDDFVTTKWGRVGKELQEKTFPSVGRKFFDKKCAEKLGKGYTVCKTVDDTGPVTTKTVDNTDLKDLARKQIKIASPVLSKLVDRLVASNIHRITTSSQITYNASTGLFSTPLGIVVQEGLDEARDLLAKIKANIDKDNQLKPLVSSYLRVIPHDIGMKFDVHTIFPDENAVNKELDLVDSLESSLSALQQKPQKADSGAKVFDLELGLLDSTSAEAFRIVRWFEKSKSKMHKLDYCKIVDIYQLIHNHNFDDSKGNVQEVFHGTTQGNCLLILKDGLKISPPSTAYISGKLFSNGIYGSKTSTKSLGYAGTGRWGGARNDSYWLFVVDFCMGSAYYPKSYGFTKLPAGYDSCWALPENTGLFNDELIVYHNEHARLKYLLEVR